MEASIGGGPSAWHHILSAFTSGFLDISKDTVTHPHRLLISIARCSLVLIIHSFLQL